MADSDPAKQTEDPNFKGGVMSPKAKQAFAEMRFRPSNTAIQKLVLDEETFEVAFLKCAMCKQRYNTSNKSARLLPCHHTYCLECILNFYSAEFAFHSEIVSNEFDIAVCIMCPNCRATFLTTKEGIRQMTPDHRVNQLIDFIGTTEKHETTYCPKHTTQCLNFFCEKCKHPVCRDCTVLDHKACMAAQQVLDIKKAKEKYVPVVQKGVEEMTTEIKSLKEKREECEKTLESCQEGDQELLTEIKQSFVKLREALNEREKALLDQTKDKTGVGKQDVEDKIKRMGEKEKEVAEVVENLKCFKDFDNLPKLFSNYEKIRNYQTEPALEKDAAKTDTPNLKFICRDEETMINRIKKFGEIQSQDRSYNGTSLYSSSNYLGSGSGSSYSSYSNGYGSSRYSGSSLSSSSGTGYGGRYYRY